MWRGRAGKTTVLSPLLGACLADGQRLVTLAAPGAVAFLRWARGPTVALARLCHADALLEMVRSTMRRALGRVWRRPIITFEFSRYTIWDDDEHAVAAARSILQRLQLCRRMCGVLVATPTSLKALFLKFVEVAGSGSQSVGAVCTVLGRMLRMFSREENGVLLLDEVRAMVCMWGAYVTCVRAKVDVCLHPLKSELNYPVGVQVVLALAPERWELVMWIVSALDPAARLAHGLDEHGRRIGESVHAVLLELAAARRVQYLRPRGLALIDASAFGEVLPALAAWTLLWLLNEFKSGRCAHSGVPLAAASVTASSCKDSEHSPGAVIAPGSGAFWCSTEFPGSAWIEVTLPTWTRISGVVIEFEPLSSFVFYRCAALRCGCAAARWGVGIAALTACAACSGQSMLPDVTYVDVCATAEGGSYEQVSCEAEFERRRVLLPRVRDARRVRVRMEGSARWFAVRAVQLLAPAAGDVAAAGDEDIAAYISGRGRPATIACLPGFAVQLVNMARDALTAFLPHALRKPSRVAFGLLQVTAAPMRVRVSVVVFVCVCAVPAWWAGDAAISARSVAQPADLLKLGARQPPSRELLAVPFMGKDAPSPCSEFAHPDVLIALTALACVRARTNVNMRFPLLFRARVSHACMHAHPDAVATANATRAGTRRRACGCRT